MVEFYFRVRGIPCTARLIEVITDATGENLYRFQLFYKNGKRAKRLECRVSLEEDILIQQEAAHRLSGD